MGYISETLFTRFTCSYLNLEYTSYSFGALLTCGSDVAELHDENRMLKRKSLII